MSARDEAAGGVELLPCPFCGGAMMFRKALWPSDGNTDAIIHAGPSVCGLAAFDVGTADESVIPIWNRRAPSPRDQACSAMLGALEKIARIREIDHFGGASMAEEIARAAIAKVALLSSDGDTA